MSKITKRLVLYFMSVLLVFTIIVTLVFTKMYSENVVQTNRMFLQENASKISASLAEYLEDYNNQRRSHMGNKSGLNSFIKIVDEITYGDVILVDSDMTIITRRMHRSDKDTVLSKETMELIEASLKGNKVFKDDFNQDENMMAVSTPVFDNEGQVIAAVFLSAPINQSPDAFYNVLSPLLIAFLISLILAFLVAMLLSRKFIKPIRRMEAVTTKLIEEDYSVETEIKMDDEIGTLAKSIDTLSKRLLEAKTLQERLEYERTQFYVDMSHELRTPVTVLRGSLELLKDHHIDDKDKLESYYVQMHQETIYLQNMINDLLDFSKLNSPDYVLKKEELNVNDVIADAIRSMRRVAIQKGVSIHFKSNTALISYTGNYEKLRQMIVIVLDNAIRFSDQGGKIIINLNQTETSLELEIQDFGKGIPEEDIPYIFDRYFTKNIEDSSGSGVGLAIAKSIADHHNMKVEVESRLKEGSIFRFKALY